MFLRPCANRRLLIVPQIRSLGPRIENKGEFFKPASECATEDQWLSVRFANRSGLALRQMRQSLSLLAFTRDACRRSDSRPALGIAPVFSSGSTAYPPIAAATGRRSVRPTWAIAHKPTSTPIAGRNCQASAHPLQATVVGS